MFRYNRVFLLSAALLLSPNLSANRFLDGLFSPLGALIIASIANFGNGVGNFIGGFRWNKRAGATDEVNAQVQEAGWLLCSAISFVLTGAIPLWAYLYALRHPPRAQFNGVVTQ